MSTYVLSEFEAMRLLQQSGEMPCQNFGIGIDFHAAGNRIIELAERIKAERAVIAMEALAPAPAEKRSGE